MACLFRLRAAQTLADAAPWGMMAGKIGRAFPVAVLGLFATGAYMTTDVWSWSTGWIDVSIVGLAVVAIQGPLIAERTGHKLGAALMANGPGPLGEEARRMTLHPGLWGVEFTNVALVLGIVWNMTQKPSTGSAILTLVIAYAVGAGLAWWFMRRRRTFPRARPSRRGSAHAVVDQRGGGERGQREDDACHSHAERAGDHAVREARDRAEAEEGDRPERHDPAALRLVHLELELRGRTRVRVR